MNIIMGRKQKSSSTTNAPPFATKDGAPRGQGATGDGRADITDDPHAGIPTPPPFGTEPTEYNPPQGQDGDGAYDVSAYDAGAGYSPARPIVDAFNPATRGTGSIGNPSRPFKVKL